MTQRAQSTAQWAAVALGFSIPISVALDGLLLALVLAGWLAAGAWRDTWRSLRANAVAAAALLLLALLAAGTLYGERYPGDAGHFLAKYLDLAWITVFAWAFREAAMRRRALHALAAGLVLVLALSYLLKAGILPESRHLIGNAAYPVVFKHRQTHGLLMALGAFLFARLALEAEHRAARLAWAAAAVLAALNATLLVQGATGYVVLGALLLYLGYCWRGWRGLGWAAAAAAASFSALLLAPGPFSQRVAQIEREIAEWEPGRASLLSSIGTRLDFYYHSLAIVRERPLMGVGTGGFPKAYAEKARAAQIASARNPHNEYLHLAVQIGLPGLAALLALFYLHWRLAPRLATPLECHLARALVLAIAVGSLFNSLLLDHTEGLLYAWLTGVLFGGLQSPREPPIANRQS
ncbi:MAG TPA: O-antigen ligase family protein [Burkholderiales bacterium]|nr:O-antigen ligase family protein [Burkholderiales bacterium]